MWILLNAGLALQKQISDKSIIFCYIKEYEETTLNDIAKVLLTYESKIIMMFFSIPELRFKTSYLRKFLLYML